MIQVGGTAQQPWKISFSKLYFGVDRLNSLPLCFWTVVQVPVRLFYSVLGASGSATHAAFEFKTSEPKTQEA